MERKKLKEAQTIKCLNWMNFEAIREAVRKHQEEYGNGSINYNLSDMNLTRLCSICDFGGTTSPLLNQIMKVFNEETNRIQETIKVLSGKPLKRLCYKERK